VRASGGGGAAGGGALGVLMFAKAMNLAAWIAAAAALGRAIGERPAPVWLKAGSLAALGVSLPVAAHAVSGMETGVATALATAAAIAVVRGRRRGAAAIAGL